MKNLTLTAVAILLLNSGCTLKAQDSRRIRIQLPALAPQSRVSAPSQTPMRLQSTFTAPTALSSFACFGLNVIGPGIANDPRMSCGSASQQIAIIGGLVPANQGYIDVVVPSGPARTIQLFGVQSTGGCPDLNPLLTAAAAGNSNSFQGIGDPYMIGAATADIFDDTSVTLKASFDPNNPVKIFQNCSDSSHPQLPPTAAYLGNIQNTTILSGITATTGVGAPEIAGTALPTASLAGFSTSLSGLPGSAGIMNQTYNGVQQRSVIQLQWDVTALDPAFTSAGLDIEMRGGGENPSGVPCAGSSVNGTYGVSAGIFVPNAWAGSQYWLLANRTSYRDSIVQWGWGGIDTLPIPLSNLIVTKSDGKKYVIVNIESEYAAVSANCQSTVHLGRAILRPTLKPEYRNNGGNSLFVTSLLPTNPGVQSFASSAFIMPPSSAASFGVSGGLPPYHFALASGGGTIDPATGRFQSTSAAASISVTDSTVPTPLSQTINISIQNPGTPVGLSLTPPTSPVIADGTCYPVNYTYLTFDNQVATPATATILNAGISHQNFGYPGALYSDAACLYPLTSLANAGAISSGIFYFKAGTAGTGILSANFSTGGAGGSSVNFTTVAGSTAQYVTVQADPTFNVGYCLPISIYASDAGKNLVPSYSNTAAFTLNDAARGGSFFIDSACATPATSFTGLPAGGLSAFYKQTAAAAGIPINVISATNGTSLPNFATPTTLQSIPAGLPTRAVLTGSSTYSVASGACAAYAVTTVDSTGAMATPTAGSINGSISIWGSNYATYADSACTTPMNLNTVRVISQAGNPPVNGYFFYLKASQAGTLSFNLQGSASGATSTYLLINSKMDVIVNP